MATETPPLGALFRAALGAALLALWSQPAFAQRTAVAPFVTGSATWTSNANFGSGQDEESDTIVELAPGAAIDVRGARYLLSGSIVLDGLYYVGGTQRDRVLPYADLLGRLEAVESLVFVEGAINTFQTADNPFDVRPVGPSTYNVFTTTQYRVSPYLQGAFGARYTYGARSDNIWTHSSGDDDQAPDGFLTLNRAFVERDVDPVGGSLSYEYRDSTYNDVSNSGLRESIARASLRFAPFARSWIGVRGGHERVEYGITDESGSLYGIEFEFSPEQRSSLKGYVEHRFFGSSWDATLSHRAARLAFSARSARLLTTYAEQLFVSEGSSSVLAELERLLPSDVKDPAERARMVREIADSRGLNVLLPSASGVYSTQVNLQTSANATAALLLPRSSAALNLYYLKSVPAPGAVPTAGVTDFTNTEQHGISLTGSYLLSRVWALSGLAAWSRTSSIDQVPQDESRQSSYRVAAIRQFSPRMLASVSVRWEALDSNVRSDATEFAVSIGALYRF
jgi:uncharacterized protein (PEP-CTERM system associated)